MSVLELNFVLKNRALVSYAHSSTKAVFYNTVRRRGNPPQPVTAPDGTTHLPRGAATNLFANGTLFVSHRHRFLWS
jgi:hypothetical protein